VQAGLGIVTLRAAHVCHTGDVVVGDHLRCNNVCNVGSVVTLTFG
jgi:hypothetical protein